MRDVQTEVSKTECEDLCLSESRWSALKNSPSHTFEMLIVDFSLF